MKPHVSKYYLLITLVAFYSSVFASEPSWREDFTELPGWTSDNATTSLILSAEKGKVTTRSAPLTSLPVSVTFRVKPVEGNQTYHNVYVRLFTDESGNINSDTYTLALTSFARKYYKISKGSTTIFNSGDGNGLLTGPENWHEITLVFAQNSLEVFNNGQSVHTMTLPDLGELPDANYLSLHAKNGNWEFDWIEVSAQDEPQTPINDSDNDGVSDDEDAFPNDPNYQYDTDLDGLPDSYEVLYGLDPAVNDAALDADGDGVSNLDEFLAGTDPSQPEATGVDGVNPNDENGPQIKSVPDQRVARSANGTTEYTYQPELTANITNVTWRKAYGPDELVVDPNTGHISWTIPSALANESFHIGVEAQNAQGSNIETWVVTLGDGNILYMGPTETHKDLTSALSAMVSGDTLIVRNGVYHGEQNKMGDFGNRKRMGPPSGTDTAFTTVLAEDPGHVIFDSRGQENHNPFHLIGTSIHPDWGHVSSDAAQYNDRSYIALKGMVTKNSDGAGIRLDNVNHVKLVDMGVVDAGRTTGAMSANVYIARSQYVLAEGLYLWGRGRYKLQFYRSSELIARRIVARIDEYHGDEPIGGLIAYCSKNVRFQNNIVVDGNARRFWTNTHNLINIYGVPATNCGSYPENIVYERSLGVNTHLGLMATWADSQDNDKPVIWKDMVGWQLSPAKYDHGAGSHIPVLSAPGPSLSDNITIGEVDFYDTSAFFYSRNRSSYINNSIFYRLGARNGELMDQGDLLRNTRSDQTLGLDHNNIFGFLGELDAGSAGTVYSTNETNIDPQLTNFLSLPANSPLRSMGKNNGRLGAEILSFKGRAGTFYNDEGFDNETQVSMWPFPHETYIQRHFRNYRYTGLTVNDDSSQGEEDTLFGARGFARCDESEQALLARAPDYQCAQKALSLDGQNAITLTSYLWEYLGTTCPENMCGFIRQVDVPTASGPYPIDQYVKQGDVAQLTTNGDLSGITFNPLLNQFMTIHNGDKIMNVFDEAFNFIRQMNNGYNGNDHEDVLFLGEKNGQHEYAIVDEYGRMFLGAIAPGADLKYDGFQRITYAEAPLVRNNGGEGVAYDANTDTFYICVEGQVSPSPMAIYQFSRPSTANDVSYNDPDLTVTSPFDAESLRSEISDISSCYFNSQSNTLILLSDVSEKLIEVSLTGEVLNSLSIDEDFLDNQHGSQFEGITFSRDFSKMILVSEDNHYVIYEHQAQ